MVSWQVTATTIYCDAVDDEVTIVVSPDWSAKCTGYRKYGDPGKETTNLVRKKSKQLKQRLECEGPECPRVTQYKDKLFAEENKKGSSAPTGRKAVVPPQKDRGSQR